eukprot:1141116-Pelagomonas_calceolata.AAC.2
MQGAGVAEYHRPHPLIQEEPHGAQGDQEQPGTQQESNPPCVHHPERVIRGAWWNLEGPRTAASQL